MINLPNRVYLIAEAGVNHNGQEDQAMALVDAAADVGADCVKFQAFRADKLATAATPKADYQKRSTEAVENQLDMLRKLELPVQTYHRLLARARDRKIDFLATPFDRQSLRLLLDLGLPRIKIGSGDITDGPLLLDVARAGLPVILSTGMSDLATIEAALSVLVFGYGEFAGRPGKAAFREAWESPSRRAILKGKVALLHCTTDYPARPEDVNLRAIDTIVAEFGLPVGLSDHTAGVGVAMAAVARGALIIEKHLTLDRNLPGPDHAASLDPLGFTDLVSGIRLIEAALGDGRKLVTKSEQKNMEIVRKVVVAARDLPLGHVLSMEDLEIKRAGKGQSPFEYWELIGQRTRRACRADEPIEI